MSNKFFYVFGVCILLLLLSGLYERDKTSKDKTSDNVKTRRDSSYSNDKEQKMKEWFGGSCNLHKSTVRTWRNSTYSNRWHTAADWFTAATRESNPELQRKLDKLNNEQWFATVQECSKQLEICVSEITSDEKIWGADSLVAEIASYCYASMYMSD